MLRIRALALAGTLAWAGALAAEEQAKPEAPKAEAVKPAAAKPDAVKAASKQGGAKAEAPKPAAAKPDAPKADAAKAEAPKPAPAKPDAPKADAPKPEAGKEEAPAAPSTAEMYDDALAAHASGDARKAAARLFAWLRGAARTSENYEVAQHLLAEDLAALGMVHGALSLEAEVVRTRGRPELVGPALENLARWTRGVAHDEQRLEDEVLHGADFGALEGPARAWVAFHQGASDLRLGNERWAALRFAELPEGSPWRARARLLTAASRLVRGAPAAEVLAEFEAVGADPKAPRDARNDAHVQAARLRFEAGDYAGALKHHAAIDLPELDPGRGQLYLEEAYTRVRLGDGSRAMGLLAALDAPGFRPLFLPEKYLLRASIFKDACHWLPAKRAARGLLRRFAPSLEAIRERRPLVADPLLADAALQKGAGKHAEQWYRQLLRERELLDRAASGWAESGLYARLADVYKLALDEAGRRRRVELERGVVRAADELLAAVEQVNLVDYEVGLALYRRAGKSGLASPLTFADPLPKGDEVGFEFVGEYWNDELPAMRFALSDRCSEGVSP